jgi:shikimate kinase
MGAGKTTLGRGVASLLNVDFVDLDEYITEKEGIDISRLFERLGEKGFRQVEKNRLTELIASPEPLVISLGGGSLCIEENLLAVKDSGMLIYLSLPLAELYRRLQDQTSKRPLLKGYEGAALTKRISELLEARQKYYNQAHLVVNALNLTPHSLYREIAASLQIALG